MNFSIISTIILPASAIIISLISVYANSLYRSINIAKKYSDICNKYNNSYKITAFDMILNYQAELAYRFYLWKSFSKLNNRKRSKFNYATFLIFTFGWLGMGLIGVIKGSEGRESYYIYLAGAGCMLFAFVIIAYSRYQANLYDKFINLRKKGLYQPTYAAIYQAKEAVIDESILPILLSFLGSLAMGYFFDTQAASIIWNIILLILTMGNEIQTIRNNQKQQIEDDKIEVQKKNSESDHTT